MAALDEAPPLVRADGPSDAPVNPLPRDGRRALALLGRAGGDAAAILQKLAPNAFAQLQGGLTQSEHDSRVTAHQANDLAQDEATIVHGIESSGLIPSIMTTDVVVVQQTIEAAFIEKSEANIDWLGLEQQLESYIGGTKVSLALIHRTTEQMYAVASSAGVSSRLYVTMQGDLNVFQSKVSADTSLYLGFPTGSGATATYASPVQVYYDNQVLNFIE